MFTNRRIRAAAVVALAVALVVPSFAATTANAQSKKVLKYGLFGEWDSLDPQNTAFAPDIALEYAFTRSLLRYDDKNQPVPSIAKEVPTAENGGISKDGKTYTYHLNDWKWSDGKPVVAGDFVYAFQRLIDSNTGGPYGNFYNDIIVNATEINTDSSKTPVTELGVKAVDDKTLEFDLVKPVSYLNAMNALWLASPNRKDIVEKNPSGWFDPANGDVPSTGPFIIKSWDHNKELVLVKNPNFSGSPAKVDEIDMPLTDDGAVSFAGYKSGELDLAGFPALELPNIKADPTLSKQLVQYGNSCSFYLGMDNSQAPFNNKQVRQAFTYAVNRDLYIKVITQNSATKQLSFLPDSIPGYDANLGKDNDYNPTKAKAALAAAGFPDGKGFPTVTYSFVASAAAQRRADWYQAQFKDVLGVNVVQNPMDGATYQAQISAKKLGGLYSLGWCADYLHPSDWLGLVFTSDSGNNSAHYSNPDFDKLSKAADAELDPAKSLAAYKKAQETLVNDYPVVFMYNSISQLLEKPGVKAKQTALDSGYPGSFWWEDVDITK